MLSDPEIIQQVLAGDTSRYRLLVDRYKDRSFSLAVGIVKDEVVAEEAIQDAFLKAFQSLSGFEGRAKFSTWLYRIVVNEALGRVRKKDILRGSEEVSELTEAQQYAVAESLDTMKQEEQKKYVRSTLDRMRPGDALVLELYYLEDFSIEEVAATTGYTQSNTKTILHRARKRFYIILREQLHDEIRSIV